MLHCLVAAGRELHLGGVLAALALAFVVFVPAALRAGGRLGGEVHQVVVFQIGFAPRILKRFRPCATADRAALVVDGRGNAGGLGCQILIFPRLHIEMRIHGFFSFVAVLAGAPVARLILTIRPRGGAKLWVP